MSETNEKLISVSGDAVRLIELLAESQSITEREALRQSISVNAFIQNEINQGSKVLVMQPDGELKELLIR